MLGLPPRFPRLLLLAASLVMLQGVATFVYGILELLALHAQRLAMGLTTGAFFLVYGAGLLLAGWGLAHHRTWARGPILFAQLVWLGLAWNFRDFESVLVPSLFGIPAAVVLVGMLTPAARHILNDDSHFEFDDSITSDPSDDADDT